MSRPLVLGTRGSALALVQAELVKQALGKTHPSLMVEVKKITTSGDRSQKSGAWIESGAGLKGMFTKEIEEALLNGKIDVAVHSCKDLPGKLAAGCALAAVLERAATDDIFISNNGQDFTALPIAARIGTSSVRRRRQLLFARPDLAIEELRGNVPTRLRKLHESDSLDGIVLAQAGLDRLGYRICEDFLEAEGAKFRVGVLAILPAIGQGAIGLEIRADDERSATFLAAINHTSTFQCIRAERELLRLLDGDCRLPVGAKTKISGARMNMEAVVFGKEGAPPMLGMAEGSADEPEKIAAEVFARLNTLLT